MVVVVVLIVVRGFVETGFVIAVSVMVESSFNLAKLR